MYVEYVQFKNLLFDVDEWGHKTHTGMPIMQ